MVSKKVEWSKLAIWGFILSFIPLITIIGLGLCIAAAIEISKSHKKGLGLAIAGMVIFFIMIWASAVLLYFF